MSKVGTKKNDYCAFDWQVLKDQLGYTAETFDIEGKCVIKNKEGNLVGEITSKNDGDAYNIKYEFIDEKTKLFFEISFDLINGCFIKVGNSTLGSYALECNSLGELTIVRNYIGKKLELVETAGYSVNAESDNSEEYAYQAAYIDRKTGGSHIQGMSGSKNEQLCLIVKNPNTGDCYTKPVYDTLEWFVKTIALDFNKAVKDVFPNINLIKLVIGSELYEKMGLANLFGDDEKKGNLFKKVSSDEE